MPMLPTDPAKLNNVVIVGNLANTVTLGDYSGDPTVCSFPRAAPRLSGRAAASSA